MKILLTGATGYIGQRLLYILLKKDFEVYCLVRDTNRVPWFDLPNIPKYIEGNLLEANSLSSLPKDINAAYYLVHSMSDSSSGFSKKEEQCVNNFVQYVNTTSCQQVIYLSGLANAEKLSTHLESRLQTGNLLRNANCAITELRAGIIVGSGSASFEIIRDLVEKLPVMITPSWLRTRCQPIAIRDVLYYLEHVLLHPQCLNQIFDIGSRDVLTYKEMLLTYAEVRQLRRYIYTLPVFSPRLSSYWLYFITAANYHLAVSLVDSMKVEVVCRDLKLTEIFDHEPLSYRKAIELALKRIAQNQVTSSWTDSFTSSGFPAPISQFIQPPKFGCYKDYRTMPVENMKQVKKNIWQIGGENGWYYGNWLWKLRGFFDILAGGVGLRRGRRDPKKLQTGDALDFWRVLVADEANNRLLLYAEMKLPGEAWLEFSIVKNEESRMVKQTATFRPHGLWGRVYWYMVLPFHHFIFSGMLRKIVQKNG
ncbi:SDR family oxidoreductase [Prolixibacteraceae bacterium JC049]|nr:SDR family oxidoreductase [Prolixibacteraceae bacterium JC049]